MVTIQTVRPHFFIKLAFLLALFVGAQSIAVSHFHIEKTPSTHYSELCDLCNAQHNLQSTAIFTGFLPTVLHVVFSTVFIQAVILFVVAFPHYYLRAPPKTV